MKNELIACGAVCILMNALCGTPDIVSLEGEYKGHLQDVWMTSNTIWWAHTECLVKTDRTGKIIRRAEVGGHHAGLEVKDGRLYTAVCAFNGEPRGATTPACHVMVGEYDAETLDRIEMHVLDINDRAGSFCFLEDGTFLVGCLRHPSLKPSEVKFHHIGRDYKLIKTYVVDVGRPVKLGIEVIRRYGNDLYLFIYGCPVVHLDAKTFETIGILKSSDGKTGFAREGDFAWVGTTSRSTDAKTYRSGLKRILWAPSSAVCEARVIPGVPYAADRDAVCRGDLYLPEKVDRQTQMVLLIHGGGWTGMDRHAVDGIADFFVKDLGFAVYNIDYRLASEKTPWPACGDDCVAAARFLLKGALATEYGLHYDRIWICGGSAGGHLTLWTLTHLPRHKVAGAVSISSIGDPAPFLRSRDWLLPKLLDEGGTPEALDPRPYVLPGMAPLLCTHATGDTVVPIASHKAFADAYRAAGNRVEFYEYPADVRPGLSGHCIWIPDSKPHRLIPEIEERIREFVRPRTDLICVYYPHWHRYPKGDEWFGADRWKEGEWCFVKDAIPRFPGHRQPIVPKHGYLNGADPNDMAKEIGLAADAGIDVFLYDYYYYNGQITQEESIERGFLKAPNRSRMKFALMWCYHERNRGWRTRPGEKPERLMTLANTTEEFLGLVRYSCEHYFNKPEYYRRGGKLFFSIYNGWKFVGERGNDVARVRSDLEKARELVRSAGLGEIHFNVQNPEDVEEMELLARCGFDSATHYNPNRAVVSDRVKARGGNPLLLDYAEVLAENRNRWRELAKAPIPYIPNLSTGWDSSPRCRLDEPFPWAKRGGNYTFIITNASPEVFQVELAAAKRVAESDPKRPGAVYVNGWNEYTEGTYLVPDNFHDDGFLRAVKSVFGTNE